MLPAEKQEKSHSVKRQEVGEGGREAKERVEKPASAVWHG